MLHFVDTFTVWNTYGKDYVVEIGTTQNGKEYANIAITSSSKNKTSGTYNTDFKGQIRFYGNACEKVKGLGLVEKDRIKVKGTIQNIGSNNRISQYLTITGWEVELAEKSNARPVPKQPEVVGELEPLDISDDTLPF